MDLDNYRNEIDKINSDIIQLIAKRFEISAQVAEYKKAHDLGVFDAEREEVMWAKIKSLAKQRQVSVDLIENIFQLIVEEAYKQQTHILEKSH